jgi:hypothetical protein
MSDGGATTATGGGRGGVAVAARRGGSHWSSSASLARLDQSETVGKALAGGALRWRLGFAEVG